MSCGRDSPSWSAWSVVVADCVNWPYPATDGANIPAVWTGLYPTPAESGKLYPWENIPPSWVCMAFTPPPTSSGGHKLLSDDVSHTFLPTDAFSAWAPSRTQLRELLAGLLLRGGEGEDREGEDERNSALSAGYMFHSWFLATLLLILHKIEIMRIKIRIKMNVEFIFGLSRCL